MRTALRMSRTSGTGRLVASAVWGGVVYRVGGSWHTTIVLVGVLPPDPLGRRDDDKMIGWFPERPELAQAVCDLLNIEEGLRGAAIAEQPTTP